MRSDWIGVLAVVGVIAAAGKFLDEYHISNRVKDRARNLLIKFFIVIDRTNVPDLVFFTFRPYTWFTTRNVFTRLIIGYSILTSSWLVLSVVVFDEQPSELFSKRFVTGLFLNILVPFSVLVLVGVLVKWSDNFFIRIIASLLLPITAYIVYVILFWSDVLEFYTHHLVHAVNYLYTARRRGMTIEHMSTFALLSIPILMILAPVILVTLLILIRLAISLIKFISIQLLDAASSPKTSPFLYASALTSLLIIVVKAVAEITR